MWLATQLAEAHQKLVDAGELQLADEQAIRNMERLLVEAQAACAAKDEALRRVVELTQYYCGPWMHLWRVDVLDLLNPAIVSSPGRPLLDELARLREENATERLVAIGTLGRLREENERLKADLAGQVDHSFRECERLRAEIVRAQDANPPLQQEIVELKGEVEHGHVRLAGCLVAADGWSEELPQETYGWSPAFQAVRDLRLKSDDQADALRLAGEALESWEAWEADLIVDDAPWSARDDGLPVITQPLMDRLVHDLQERRQRALAHPAMRQARG